MDYRFNDNGFNSEYNLAIARRKKEKGDDPAEIYVAAWRRGPSKRYHCSAGTSQKIICGVPAIFLFAERKLEAAHELTEEKMKEILRELKANQRNKKV